MSTERDNGGPAFPDKRRVTRMGYETNEFEPVPGMTLRDYFAAKAMQAILGPAFANGEAGNPEDAGPIANAAYFMADAMIKARQS